MEEPFPLIELAHNKITIEVLSMTGIYAIHNVMNDKYYIGQANDIHNRWIQHRSRLRCGKHENNHLQASYDIYKENSFEYFVVEECDVEQLDEKEQYYIQKYDSYNNGYNQDLGGAGCKGYKHTEEEILKMRRVQNPKPVLQIDSQLNIVNRWESSAHASKTLGFYKRGIDKVCCREDRQKSIGGYIWVYEEEYKNNQVDWDYYLNVNESKSKKVSQYDLDMNLVKVWESIYQVQVELGYCHSQITRNCNMKSKTAYNFVWRFTDEYTEEQYQIDCGTTFLPSRNNKTKQVEQYDVNMNLIRVWCSAGEIERETGWSRASICECCAGKSKQSHGYIWRFIESNSISQ
jgi:group I intron endonuclease